MLLPNFFAFLIKSGLIFTSGLVTFRAIVSLLRPPLQLTPVIYTNDGAVQGRIGYSRNGSDYWEFLAIRYALPPVSALRFQPPIPAKQWEGVKKVIRYPPACVQFEPVIFVRARGQEDCLFLNVFVNPVKTNKKKAVLIFVHGGGGFSGDSSIYHPEYFMDHPIVLVTFHYRLGPFSFLNFQENDPRQRFPRGNMGLKDQNLVLQWVQRNIANFGGDPNQVSLIGQSAGAVFAHLHMLSPQSEGLFHRAILVSGNALSSWGFSANPRKIAKAYAGRVGCPTENMTKLFECFMRFDAIKLVQQQFTWADPLYERDLFLLSVETEPYFRDDVFLNDSPEGLLRSLGERQKSRIPLMIGVMSGDGVVRSARFQAMPELIPKLDKNWDALIGRVLLQEYSIIKPRIAQELKNLYFSNSPRITGNITSFMKNLTKLTSDVLFFEPAHRTAMEHSKLAPTYMFYFDYKSVMLPAGYSFYRSVRMQDRGRSEVKLLQGLYTDWLNEHMLGQPGAHQYGIGHGEDLYQLWNINGLTKWFSDGDMKFSRAYVKSIVDFSRGVKSLTFRGTPWPPASSGVLKRSPEMLVPFMLMDNYGKASLTEEPFFSNRVEVLNKLFTRY